MVERATSSARRKQLSLTQVQNRREQWVGTRREQAPSMPRGFATERNNRTYESVCLHDRRDGDAEKPC